MRPQVGARDRRAVGREAAGGVAPAYGDGTRRCVRRSAPRGRRSMGRKAPGRGPGIRLAARPECPHPALRPSSPERWPRSRTRETGSSAAITMRFSACKWARIPRPETRFPMPIQRPPPATHKKAPLAGGASGARGTGLGEKSSFRITPGDGRDQRQTLHLPRSIGPFRALIVREDRALFSWKFRRRLPSPQPRQCPWFSQHPAESHTSPARARCKWLIHVGSGRLLRFNHHKPERVSAQKKALCQPAERIVPPTVTTRTGSFVVARGWRRMPPPWRLRRQTT